MNKQIRVNIATRVNNASIRREERNGREVIIVPSATLPFNVVMNGGLYPEEEIRAAYNTFERTRAPVGHPIVNGVYVSALDVEGDNEYGVGAWNENVRIDGNRVRMDKVIDVQRANSSERGRRLLDAINKEEPIHSSTGLLLEREEVEGDGYEWVARNMIGDHDAFLLDEQGAATPEDGVGIFVNSKGEKAEVHNVKVNEDDSLPNSFEVFREDLMRAVEEKYGDAWVEDFNDDSLIFRAERFDHDARKVSYSVADGEITIGDDIQEVQRKTTWETVNRLFQSVKTMLNFKSDEAAGLSLNRKDEGNEMPITEEQFKALEGKVDKLVANASDKPVAEQITEAVQAAVKPIQDQMAANAEAEKAKEKAEHEAAVNKVVEAEILDKDVADTMDTVALNALMEKFGKPGDAFGVNGAFRSGEPKTIAERYSLPEGE